MRNQASFEPINNSSLESYILKKDRWQSRLPARRTCATRVRTLKRDSLALYLAARHPRTLWYAKALAAFLAAYLLSPIDLIPDFVPVLGYLDDLVVALVLAPRLVPRDVTDECVLA